MSHYFVLLSRIITNYTEHSLEPNAIFKKLAIPLSFSLRLADQILDEQELLSELREIEESDLDALLCFNHGVIRGKFELNSGHVTVFDRIIDNKVRLVDASPRQPKWRLIEPSLLLDAIKHMEIKVPVAYGGLLAPKSPPPDDFGGNLVPKRRQ